MSERILRLAIPAGSLKDATVELFRKAGYDVLLDERSYYPVLDDQEITCTLIRAQEIPRYVQDGLMDAGLTGHDWIIENGASLVEVGELLYSKVSRRPARWVLAVPEASPIRSVGDLEGKRIATEVVNIDIEASFALGPNHVGDDGPLSTVGGTLWNIVLSGVDCSNLRTEFGAPSPVLAD